MKKNPVFEVTEEDEQEVTEEENKELEEAYANKTYRKKGDIMFSSHEENIISKPSEGVNMAKIVTKKATFQDLFNTEVWGELDPLPTVGWVMREYVETAENYEIPEREGLGLPSFPQGETEPTIRQSDGKFWKQEKKQDVNKRKEEKVDDELDDTTAPDKENQSPNACS